MTTFFDDSINKLLGIEGGYSKHKDDPGGATRYGITEEVARRHGYKGLMEELPLETAKGIYKKDYWDTLNLDAIATIFPLVADELFDTGVNCGPGRVVKWLQTSLNAFNNHGRLYPDILEDGQIGPATMNSLRMYSRMRGMMAQAVLVSALNAQQGCYYLSLAAANVKFESFTFGWFVNRVL